MAVKNKTTEKKEKDCKECKICKKSLPLANFYSTTSTQMFPDGKIDICKVDIKKMIPDINDLENLYKVLQLIDKPFLFEVFQECKDRSGDTVGNYFRIINSLSQYRRSTWKNSVFDLKKSNNKESNNEADANVKKGSRLELTDALIDKWGDYPIEEISAFERKYQLLKNNYQEKTAMHTEALLIYIRYRVKEELATMKGDIKDAKDWGALAQKAAQDAKINPSQLSKSDLSDGLDTFGQLVRSVEQVVDIISILPKFKEKPQDKVDFTLFCYINYIRDMKGLPLVEYEEIYKFYEVRKKEYQDVLEFLREDDN